MKINMDAVTAVGTWMLAACAILALYQTASTQRQSAELNAKAVEYYERQNQLLQPAFHVENKTLSEYEGFEQKSLLPLRCVDPGKFIKDIRVYCDGGRIRTLSVDIETHILVGMLNHVNSQNNDGCLMVIPVKDYYAGFEQNGQVRGMVAKGGVSAFQEEIYNSVTNYNARHNGAKELVAQPFDLATFEYDDWHGRKCKVTYSAGMEVGDTFDDLDAFSDSKEIFKSVRFTACEFDIEKIIEKYAPQFIEREKVRREKRKAERSSRS